MNQIREHARLPAIFIQDIPHYRIETNNYVESWLHHLKAFYLRLMRKQRVDVILYILSEKVEPDFRRSALRVSLNFEQPTYSKVEIQYRKVAQKIDSAEAEEMVAYDEDSDNLVVQSFSTEDI